MMYYQNLYNQVIADIYREKDTERERLASSFIHLFCDSDSNDTLHEQEDLSRQHDENLFALLCLKVNLYFELHRETRQVSDARLIDDLKFLVEEARQVCFEYEVTEELLNNVFDVLLLVFPDNKDVLLSWFSSKNRIHKDRIGISQGLYCLAMQTAKTYERLGYKKYYLLLLKGLCSLSRLRNTREMHQELVTRVLAFLVDKEPLTAIQIAYENKRCFEDCINNNAGNFYWFLGCALQKVDKTNEAMHTFKECYHIRKSIYGEGDWYTAVAKREISIIRYHFLKEEKDREDLIQFIQNIEEGKYVEANHDSLMITEGKTLYVLLMDQSQISDFQEYEQLLIIYEDICEKYDSVAEPLVKKRLSKNLRGGFYLKVGNYIQAESCFIEALHCHVPDSVPEILTVPQVKSNLLMAYYVQNDLDMAVPLLDELLDLLDPEAEQTGLSEKDEYRILSLLISIESQNMLDPEKDELNLIKNFSDSACEDILGLSASPPDYINELCAFLLCAIPYLLLYEVIKKEEFQLYLNTMEKINSEIVLFQINQQQRVILHHITALLLWDKGSSIAEVHFQNAMQLAQTAILPLSMRIALTQSYASYLGRYGRDNLAMCYVNHALTIMEKLWKSYVIYLNDERLMQILIPTQVQFTGCYAILRTITNLETVYTNVLKFKQLASLAGRERNRILHKAKIDKELLNSIKIRQDKIAALETGSVFGNNEVGYKKEMAELRKLEADFANSFQIDTDFVDISYDNVKRALPDNSVVIEFFYCTFEYGKTSVENKNDKLKTGFDVFIIQKIAGECRLDSLTIENGEQLLSLADEFVTTLQAVSNGTVTIDQLNELESIRRILFQNLLQPILVYIREYENVFIAPDQNLINLPFELLHAERAEQLPELIKAVKIECARDFLYKDQTDLYSDENLIIGNPKYEVSRLNLGDVIPDYKEPKRFINADHISISQLPFSQMEVERIGKRLRCRYYTGFDAVKQLLMAAPKKYKIIHIATHGYFDDSNLSNKVQYSSGLLFSGVANWLTDRKISSIYGNGIATADEISRLDLRGTEIVVLSSCLSGMNEISINKGFLGMIGAFSAAGVHYVIAHLWSAEDFSAAVLMDAFYYQLIERKQSPPNALGLAKDYLRKVTIGELKNNQWFKKAETYISDSTLLSRLSQYEKMNEEIQPFKNEAFWGGFVCYQCY